VHIAPVSTAVLPHISVVVPLYNEEDNVEPLCAAVRAALDPGHSSYELLLVDDGSTDATVLRVDEQARRDGRVRALHLVHNAGQTAAMAAGFAHARGRVIVSMDGDLQNDPADIPMLVRRLDSGYDVVCGWRKERQDRWLSRKIPSRVANRMIAWITGIPIHDNGCSLKAYRAEVIRSLNLYSEMHRFLPALSSMTGARIAEVVVRHHPRLRGQSKYGIARTFKVLADIVTIKMITQFANRPGHWFGLLSLPWLGLAAGASVIWIGSLIGTERHVTIVFSTLAVMFAYLFGHMLSLAVLSEFLLAQSDRRYLRRLVDVLSVRLDAAEGGRR
jgi:glycosyltransferase involved in cell wall biosynthesis